MTGEIFAEKCLFDAGVAIVPGTSFGQVLLRLCKI